MNPRLFYFFLLLLFHLAAAAQKSITLLHTPFKYEQSPDGDLIEDGKTARSSNFWIVFSDRDGNKVYDKPDSSAATIVTAGFLDKFYVTAEKGPFLELYKWQEGIKLSGTKKGDQLDPDKAVRVGWMKKETLLLWMRCLQNKDSHFSELSFFAVTGNNINRLSANAAGADSVNLYKDPGLQQKGSNKAFQFIYIYKRSGSSALIGITDKSNSFRIQNDVLGWVDESLLQKWNNRLFIEPNWNQDAAAARKTATIRASLFIDKKGAENWKSGLKSNDIPLWDKDPYEQPWPASIKRFPVFETEGDLINTGFFASLFIEKKNKPAPLLLKADKTKKNTRQITKDLKQVNIIFVIEAGAGMQRSVGDFHALAEKLTEHRNKANWESEKKWKYRYAAVVYRSEENRNCAGGIDFSLNKISLTADVSSVISFLKAQLDKKGCSSNELNNNTNTALLEALKMIKAANAESIQSNCILFLGGATGNTSPAPKIIPQLIADYNVSLTAFQVYSKPGPAFKNFSTNFIQTIKSAGAINAQPLIKGQKIKTDALKYEDSANLTIFKFNFTGKNTLFGSIIFPKAAGAVSTECIESTIDHSLNYSEQYAEINLSDVMSQENVSINKNNLAVNPDINTYFQKIGVTINNNTLLGKFSEKYSQLFIPAWTSISAGNLADPVFKKGVYINEEELVGIIKQFEGLTFAAGSAAEVRNLTEKAYQLLAINFIGKEDKLNKSLTLDSILSRVSGLACKSDVFKTVKLGEIKNKNKVTDEMIAELESKIRNSLDHLKTVSRDAAGSMRDAREEGVFYWITEDYFP